MTYDSRSKNFSCDSCAENIEVEADGFGDAWAEAKAQGWRAYIGPDKKFAHSCPSCCEYFAKENRK